MGKIVRTMLLMSVFVSENVFSVDLDGIQQYMILYEAISSEVQLNTWEAGFNSKDWIGVLENCYDSRDNVLAKSMLKNLLVEKSEIDSAELNSARDVDFMINTYCSHVIDISSSVGVSTKLMFLEPSKQRAKMYWDILNGCINARENGISDALAQTIEMFVRASKEIETQTEESNNGILKYAQTHSVVCGMAIQNAKQEGVMLMFREKKNY